MSQLYPESPIARTCATTAIAAKIHRGIPCPRARIPREIATLHSLSKQHRVSLCFERAACQSVRHGQTGETQIRVSGETGSGAGWTNISCSCTGPILHTTRKNKPRFSVSYHIEDQHGGRGKMSAFACRIGTGNARRVLGQIKTRHAVKLPLSMCVQWHVRM